MAAASSSSEMDSQLAAIAKKLKLSPESGIVDASKLLATQSEPLDAAQAEPIAAGAAKALRSGKDGAVDAAAACCARLGALTSGAALGAKLFVRLLFTDTSSAAAELRDLKGALADAMSTTSKEKSALQAATDGHLKQLAHARSQLGHKLRGVQARATDSEVSHFRTALDKRLIGARAHEPPHQPAVHRREEVAARVRPHLPRYLRGPRSEERRGRLQLLLNF